MSPQELVDRLLAGDPRAASRLISLLENQGDGAREAMALLYPHTGRAHIVGVTGPPGGGKSSLVNLLSGLLRRREVRVGVVAVDPTSPYSGGAFLGDRIRMQERAGDPGIFIRSMASRGQMGGLARATQDAVRVLDAFGAEVIFVETVGAGQAEVDIAETADTTVVVLSPATGDDIQAFKAGMMEIADLFVVNKADLAGADETVRAVRALLSVGRQLGAVGEWDVPVVRTIARTGEGGEELLGKIQAHREHLQQSGSRREKERLRARRQLRALLQARLEEDVMARRAEAFRTLVEQVASRERDPYSALEELLA